MKGGKKKPSPYCAAMVEKWEPLLQFMEETAKTTSAQVDIQRTPERPRWGHSWPGARTLPPHQEAWCEEQAAAKTPWEPLGASRGGTWPNPRRARTQGGGSVRPT